MHLQPYIAPRRLVLLSKFFKRCNRLPLF